jgi:hypothetical protein
MSEELKEVVTPRELRARTKKMLEVRIYRAYCMECSRVWNGKRAHASARHHAEREGHPVLLDTSGRTYLGAGWMAHFAAAAEHSVPQ